LSSFLLKKNFFKLFLHWDDVVRNYYQQLLVFKMVRMKRSELHKQGFIMPEFSGKTDKPETKLDGSVPVPPENPNSDASLLDLTISAKIRAYVQSVEDQLRQKVAPEFAYPPELEVYAPKAIGEYKQYVCRYSQWEERRENKMPGLVPLSIINGRAINFNSISPNSTELNVKNKHVQ